MVRIINIRRPSRDNHWMQVEQWLMKRYGILIWKRLPHGSIFIPMYYPKYLLN